MSGRKGARRQRIRGMNEEEWRQELRKVHHFIQGNGPIYNSRQFAHLIVDRYEFPGKTMKQVYFEEDSPRATAGWNGLLSTLRSRDWVIYDKPSIGERTQWRINDRWLDSNMQDKTGVTTTIPYTPEKQPNEPTVLPPAISEEEVYTKATEYLEAQMRLIQINSATIVSGAQCFTEFSGVTLYDLYKIGLAQQLSLGTGPADSPTPVTPLTGVPLDPTGASTGGEAEDTTTEDAETASSSTEEEPAF